MDLFHANTAKVQLQKKFLKSWMSLLLKKWCRKFDIYSIFLLWKQQFKAVVCCKWYFYRQIPLKPQILKYPKCFFNRTAFYFAEVMAWIVWSSFNVFSAKLNWQPEENFWIFACDLGLNRKTLPHNFFRWFVFHFREITHTKM